MAKDTKNKQPEVQPEVQPDMQPVQEPSISPVSLNEARSMLDGMARTFDTFSGAKKILDYLAGVNQAELEALSRRDAAVKAADQAEKEAAVKLEMYTNKIQRASEESGRILEKAKDDAKHIVDTATAEAKSILDPARTEALALAQESAKTKAALSELNRSIELAMKERDDLNAVIAAAQEKIASFTK